MNLDIQKNKLHYYIDLLRMRDLEQRSVEKSKSCIKALHNVIRTMQYSRNDKICGENLSRLDWGNIPFNGIYFSLNGSYPSDFSKCRIHETNFFSGHSERINDALWTPDGSYILTAGDDGTVCVWSASSKLMIRRLFQDLPLEMSRRNQIYNIKISVDNRYCMTFARKRKLIWNIETGELIPLRSRPSELCQRQKSIATILNESSVKWEYIQGLENISGLRFSLRKQISAIREKINMTENPIQRELEEKLNSLFSYLEESGEKECGFEESDFIRADADIRQLQSQLNNKELLLAIINPIYENIVSKFNSGNKEEICLISNDREWCMSINEANNLIKIWNIESGKMLMAYGLYCKDSVHRILIKSCDLNAVTKSLYYKQLEEETGLIFYNPGKEESPDLSVVRKKLWDKESILCISPDARQCITKKRNTDNYVYIRDLLTGDETGLLNGRVGEVGAVSISNDQKLAITGSSDGSVILWDLISHRVRTVLNCGASAIASVSVSSKNRYCCIGTDDGRGFLYNIKTNTIIQSFQCSGKTLTAISPDEKFCAFASGNSIFLWSMEDNDVFWKSQWNKSYLESLIFSNNSNYLTVGTIRNGITIFDIPNGMSCWQIESEIRGKAISFSKDDQYIFVNGKSLIELKSKQTIFEIPYDLLTISYSLYSNFIRDKQVMVIYLDKITVIDFEKSTMEHHDSGNSSDVGASFYFGSDFDIYSISASSDGRLIIIGTTLGVATLLEWNSMEVVDELFIVPGCHIRCCAFDDITSDEKSAKIIYQYN